MALETYAFAAIVPVDGMLAVQNQRTEAGLCLAIQMV
jgi:hypothetical protein